MGIDFTVFGLRVVFHVIVEGKRKGRRKKPRKDMGYIGFYDVNRICTSKW